MLAEISSLYRPVQPPIPDVATALRFGYTPFRLTSPPSDFQPIRRNRLPKFVKAETVENRRDPQPRFHRLLGLGDGQDGGQGGTGVGGEVHGDERAVCTVLTML